LEIREPSDEAIMGPQQLREMEEWVEVDPGPLPTTGPGGSHEAALVHSFLCFPVPGATPVPSEAEMGLLGDEAERDRISSLAAAAHDQVMKVQGVGDLDSVLAMLVAYLVDLLGDGEETEREAFEGPVCMGATLGYVIGTMENASGVARAGKSEAHYLMAMHVAQAGLPVELQTIAYQYAKESGYCLARNGEDCFNEIVAEASTCVDQLRMRAEAP
jgi:hypothetical protein